MMSNTVIMLDVSLSKSGGADVFSNISAVHVIKVVQESKSWIKDFIIPTTFPDGGGLDVQALQKSVNKPTIDRAVGDSDWGS